MDLRPVAALLLCACAFPAPKGSSWPSAPGWTALSLTGDPERTQNVSRLTADAKWTVFVFFSPDCHCLAVHEGRLRALEAAYRARGVQFFWIDSEAGTSIADDSAAAKKRGYTFPILHDTGAKVAHWLGAEFATYSVVLDPAGVVRYRGGIDSDKNHLRDDATPYLQNALDDLTAGREPRLAEGEALGCALRTQ